MTLMRMGVGEDRWADKPYGWNGMMDDGWMGGDVASAGYRAVRFGDTRENASWCVRVACCVFRLVVGGWWWL
jgi:hypothetical protein